MIHGARRELQRNEGGIRSLFFVFFGFLGCAKEGSTSEVLDSVKASVERSYDMHARTSGKRARQIDRQTTAKNPRSLGLKEVLQESHCLNHVPSPRYCTLFGQKGKRSRPCPFYTQPFPLPSYACKSPAVLRCTTPPPPRPNTQITSHQAWFRRMCNANLAAKPSCTFA